MAQTKPKAGQFYGVSNNGTDGQFLKTDGTGGMSWDSPITNPTITSIDYPGSTTAADPAGGQSVIINGTLFASGVTCTVGGTSAVTAFNSATQITITTPAKAAGPYTVAVTNTNGGTAYQANFIQYSGVPVWSTAAGTLGNVLEGGAASFQVTATEGSDTIEYAVTTGTLPTGLSLATATGAITGTAGSVSADTTTTFSITATDDENQTSSERSFSITVQNDAPSNHFNTVLYTGNSSTQAVTGLGFEPDLVWIKSRSVNSHQLTDSVRGVTKNLFTNVTNAEATETNTLQSFDVNGFTVGNEARINYLGDNVVAWNFKAGGAAVANTDGTINSQVSVNNTLGFSIVGWTTTAAGSWNVGHGLDTAPEMIISKMTSFSNSWEVYHKDVGTGKYLLLSTTAAAGTDSGAFSSVTDTTWTSHTTNTTGNYIAYCFTSKPGFSKVGSYTGNGSASGPIVQTGFEPAFIMLKPTSVADNWMIYDNKRGDNKVLFPNLSNAESTYDGRLSFLANGFQITTTNSGWNGSGQTYIYLAIAADGSTATPSLANSFATEIYTGNRNSRSISTGFAPDFVWIKNRPQGDPHMLFDSVRGATKFLFSNATDSEGTSATSLTSFNSDGFSLGAYDGRTNDLVNYVSWNWKAGGTPSINTDGTITSVVSANQAAGFSIVKFTAPSSGVWTYGHQLNVAPELIIIKNLTQSGQDWQVFLPAILGNNKKLILNATSSEATTGVLNNTNPTNTVITQTGYGVGTDNIAYCFHSVPGYSKVGTYTGNGNATGPTITTGFEPSFVMIKSTSITGAWMILDNKRSPSNPRQLLLQPQSGAVEQNVGNAINFNSNDFQLTDTNSSRNQNGATYIYLAIKEN